MWRYRQCVESRREEPKLKFVYKNVAYEDVNLSKNAVTYIKLYKSVISVRGHPRRPCEFESHLSLFNDLMLEYTILARFQYG